MLNVNNEEIVVRHFPVSEDDEGMRVDTFLCGLLSGFSRTRIQRLIERGEAVIDSSVVGKNLRVRKGQVVIVRVGKEKAKELLPEAIPLDIVFEDEDLVVLAKQAGLVVHPAHGNWTGTLVNALIYHFGHLSGIAGKEKTGIVHRLDKKTTGLMVVCKNDSSHLAISAAFSDRRVWKEYLALCYGGKFGQTGTIDGRIARSTRDRKKFTVVSSAGRSATTHYRLIASYFDCLHLLLLRLETGRTHQIRVHLRSLGAQIVGDGVYGGCRYAHPGIPGQLREAMDCLSESHLLHSHVLSFDHPGTANKLHFRKQPSGDFARILALCCTLSGNPDGREFLS